MSAVQPFPSLSWGAGTDPDAPLNPGSDLYESAIRQMYKAAAAAEALGYDWYFAGIIWHQGEGNQSSTASAFQLMQDTIFNGFRERLGVSDLPIIAGSFIYEIVDPPLFNNAINRQVCIDVARRLPRTSFFYGPGPGYQMDTGTNFAHFNADGQRILARGAVDAYAIAINNVVGTRPSDPTVVQAAQIGTELHIWWTRPLCRVTDYDIQYAVGGGAWADLSKPAGPLVTANVDCGQRDLPAAQITDIVEDSSYQVRVRSRNENGISGWSETSAVTVSLPAQVTGLTVGAITQSTIAITAAPAARATSYIAEYSLDDAAWTVAASGLASPSYTYVGLNPLTTYYLRMAASNAAGNGLASSPSTTATTVIDILDDALSSGAKAAVFNYISVSRRVKESYTGNLIRVRRSSDNTQQDIPQTASKILDEAALLAFCGAGDGYIVTTYSQSGGADLAQANTANQPRIVSGGVINKVNGRPAADQTMDGLRVLENTTPGLYAAGKASVFAVLRATGGGAISMECGSAGSNPRYAPLAVGSSGNTLSRTITNDAGTAIETSNTSPQVAVNAGYHTVGVIDSGSSLVMRQDGSTTETKAYTRSGVFTIARKCIFGQHNGATFAGIQGHWSEIVEFTDTLSDADRNAIEANMAAWYSTDN